MLKRYFFYCLLKHKVELDKGNLMLYLSQLDTYMCKCHLAASDSQLSSWANKQTNVKAIFSPVNKDSPQWFTNSLTKEPRYYEPFYCCSFCENQLIKDLLQSGSSLRVRATTLICECTTDWMHTLLTSPMQWQFSVALHKSPWVHWETEVKLVVVAGQKLQSAGVVVDMFPLHNQEKLKSLCEAWYSGNQLSQPLGERTHVGNV